MSIYIVRQFIPFQGWSRDLFLFLDEEEARGFALTLSEEELEDEKWNVYEEIVE